VIGILAPNEAYDVRQAGKLSRVYADLMLALDKHRGKGQQRVTVEHVHVHQGGKAIVGAIQAGGGASNNPEGQSHAKTITHAPGETLPSEIEAVDIAGAEAGTIDGVSDASELINPLMGYLPARMKRVAPPTA
jgi:hypothetical protein